MNTVKENHLYDFRGTHYLGSFINCKYGLNGDLSIPFIKEGLKTAIILSGANILNSIEHTFENGGFTIVFLLSESHASIHSYPEHNSFFVDFFTCGNSVSNNIFHKTMIKIFNPEIVNKQIIERN
jgi:S-adenosylmethionine decarboxylase